MINKAGSGHPGGSLSIIDLVMTLYETTLRHNPKKPSWEERDRFILSSGHQCPALYTVLADQGYFAKKHLSTLRTKGSKLQGHPEYKRLPGIENTSGPLGQGYTVAVGKAIAAKRQGKHHCVFCLSSDGEHDEGAVWEAAQLAAHHQLNNLCVIIDRNHLQIDGRTEDSNNLRNLKEKYQAFGFTAVDINGHDIDMIKDALTYFDCHKSQQPFCIVAHTHLGKGVSFMENNPVWHGKAPDDEELAMALAELKHKAQAAKLHHALQEKGVLR